MPQPESGLLLNIDVPDLAAGEAFYTAAWGLTPGRRFGSGFVELLGFGVPVYLIEATHDCARHWTPIHPDIAVADLDAAIARAGAAGAVAETPIRTEPYGRIATFADPFGHGFCLIEFTPEGYDAIA